MRKSAVLLALCLGLAIATGPAPAWADPQCAWALNMERAFCSPPFGDMVHDINSGKFLCGAGQCVQNPSGEFRCSVVPGGAAILDSRSRAACVGGCAPPSESLCAVPKP